MAKNVETRKTLSGLWDLLLFLVLLYYLSCLGSEMGELRILLQETQKQLHNDILLSEGRQEVKDKMQEDRLELFLKKAIPSKECSEKY